MHPFSQLDCFTLDQLRMFVAIADEGSFSAAAKRVHRVQSALSHAMTNLESTLGVELWDRSTRVPRLTAQGEVLLSHARQVLDEVDSLKRAAINLSSGLEPCLHICVDQLLPQSVLLAACRSFAEAYPGVCLNIHSETLKAVSERVLDGTCALGIVGPAAATPALVSSHLMNVRLVPCVSRQHPLAGFHGQIPFERLNEHTQIVLSERLEKGVADQAVLSSRTWRVTDLKCKHELIRAGLGWGNLPCHMIHDDLETRVLVAVNPEAWDHDGFVLPLSIAHHHGASLGPAARGFQDALIDACRGRSSHLTRIQLQTAPTSKPADFCCDRSH